MEFDLEKSVQILREVLKIDEGKMVTLVKSVWNGSESHRQCEVKLSEAPLNTNPYVIAYFEVPDYESALEFLSRFGSLEEDLTNYLKTSFSQNKPRYLTILNFHDSWASSRINVTSSFEVSD